MRTTATVLIALAFSIPSVSADDFTLKNAAGESFGPFPIKEGAVVRLDDANYRISSITNTAEQYLLKKLQTIIIPEMRFKDALMEQVIDFLRKAAKQYDPTGEGVAIGFTASPLGFATNMPPADRTNAAPSVTMSANQIPLREALRLACSLSDFRAVVRRNSVLVLPIDAPADALVRRLYDILPSFLQRVIDVGQANPEWDVPPDNRADMKQTLAGFGVQWPRGSSIQHLPAVGKLIVVNTEDNLADLERVMSVLNVVPCQIRLEFFFVAFPTSMVTRAPSGRHFTSDDALKLWKEGKGRAVSTLLVITKSASEATTKDVNEFIYPTEFSFAPSGQESNPPPSTFGSAFTPGGFETREVGAIVSVMPEITPDGQIIDLTFTPQFVEEPAWEDYKAVVVSAGSSPTNVTCRQPTFSGHTVSTQLSVRRGSTVVVGGGWNLRRTPEVMYLIIKTDLVDIDGKVLPPPDLNAILPDSL